MSRVSGKAFGFHPVAGEVEFLSDLRSEVVDKRDRVIHTEFRAFVFEQLGDGSKQDDILFDPCSDLWPLDLKRKNRSVLHYRTVDLRN